MLSIRDLRKDMGVSRGELAEALGISLSTLGYYERGERVPDADVVRRLAEFLSHHTGQSISADYLLGLTPFPNDGNIAEAKEKAEGISQMLSDVNPAVRDEFLSVLEELLLVGGSAVSSASAVLFERLTDIIGHLVNIKIAYTGGVAQYAKSLRRESGSEREGELEREMIPAKFTAQLAESCAVGRGEFDRLSQSLSPMFKQDCEKEAEVVRMKARGDTEPRRSGEEAADDGDGD